MGSIHDKEIWIFLSIVCGLAAYAAYLRGMYRKITKPHCFTWLIAGFMTWIAFAAQVADHAGLGMWANFLTAFMCTAIGLLAIPHGEKDITKTDWIALAGCILCIILWIITRDPTASVVLATLIDITSTYPTFRKIYGKPFEERASAYGINAFKFLFGFMALDKVTISSALFLASNVILCGGLAAMILWRRTSLPARKRR